mgnify:CR=1 FL=1
MPCHFLKLSDFSGETLRYMIDRAKVIKADLKAGKRYEPFAGKVLIMVFEKASTSLVATSSICRARAPRSAAPSPSPTRPA